MNRAGLRCAFRVHGSVTVRPIARTDPMNRTVAARYTAAKTISSVTTRAASSTRWCVTGRTTAVTTRMRIRATPAPALRSAAPPSNGSVLVSRIAASI